MAEIELTENFQAHILGLKQIYLLFKRTFPFLAFFFFAGAFKL